MIASKAGAYNRGEPFLCSFRGQASGLTHKYQTRLDWPDSDKHSRLVGPFIRYKENKVLLRCPFVCVKNTNANKKLLICIYLSPSLSLSLHFSPISLPLSSPLSCSLSFSLSQWFSLFIFICFTNNKDNKFVLSLSKSPSLNFSFFLPNDHRKKE